MINDKISKRIGLWLVVGVLMIIVQIILGGITRLTGSGLSITEWKPLLGAIPPLNNAEWEIAFKKYQEIAQFKHLNSHFSLSDFKFIYFWEWFHRLWGRVLGIVFLIPFIFFWVKGYFTRKMIVPLLILFILGGLQGVIGWIMVQSGLNNENLYVSHFRLAIHFIAALVVLVYTFWFAMKVLVPERYKQPARYLKNFAIIIVGILTIQLCYGAFMAGLKAGVFAPTWPDINGAIIPSHITELNGREFSWLSAWVNHPVAIHFIHRNLAYLLTILVAVWTFKASKVKHHPIFNSLKWWPAILVLLQVILGVFATVTSMKAVPQGWGVFEWNAQLHQINAILLLLSLTAIIYVLGTEKNAHPAMEPVKQDAISKIN